MLAPVLRTLALHFFSRGLNIEKREVIDGAISAYRGKTRFSTEGLEDVRAVVGEAIPGPGSTCIPKGSLGFLRMNYRKKFLGLLGNPGPQASSCTHLFTNTHSPSQD